MNENTCVCCGDQIPEGRQICPKCEKGGDIGIAKMTLEEAIENLENPHIHSLTLNNSELTKWLKELRDARRLIKSQAYYIETHIDDKNR